MGDSLTGKSTAIDIVRKFLLKHKSIKCKLYKINPSQVDNSILFGHYDAQRFEWINGILSQKLSEKIENECELWILMDGILNSNWIESMNTLLDNNKKVEKNNCTFLIKIDIWHCLTTFLTNF